jgi:branched-chain amino acid transport system permease protein
VTDTQLSESISLQPVRGRRKWTKPAILAVLVLIIAILPLLISSPYLLHIIILTFVYTAASVSLRAIIISGQFPLAHGAFMGIGAYVAGMVSRWLSWPPWFTIPLGAFIAGGIGIVFGYPFCRLRALYYGMGSLFFGIAVISVIQSSGTVTGGYTGLAGIHPIFTGASKVPYYYFFLGLALISVIALYRFEFSRIGVTLKAVAQSHLVASSVGINESWYRILAVGVGCFFVGLIGAGYAHYNGLVTPTSFDLLKTFWLLMYVLIGGINSFAGPIIGTPILFLIPEYFRGLKEYSPFLTAGILIIIAYRMPDGIVGLIKLIMLWYSDRKAGKVKGAIHAS